MGMPGDCANVRPALSEDHSAWFLGQHGKSCLCQLLLRTQGITGVIMDSVCTMRWLWLLGHRQKAVTKQADDASCVQDLSFSVTCACVLEALMSIIRSALIMKATPMSALHAAEAPELSQQALRAALSLISNATQM